MIRRIFFSLVIALILLLVLAIAIPLPPPPNDARDGNFVFSNVHVVDVEAGVIIRNQDVFVERGIVSRIARSGQFEQDGFIAIDGTDKYLMPGLWDMHTHSIKLSPQLHHPLFIANGVTSIRDMSGCLSEPDSFWACPEDREAWNTETIAGDRIAPRYPLQSSYQINGGDEVPEDYPAYFRANDVGQIPELVSYNAASGVDFLKTYTDISSEAYLRLEEEADARGLYLAGHRPIRISLEEAVSAGQRSIEHPRLFIFECFEGAVEFRRLADPKSAFDVQMKRRMIDGHDAEACAKLMAQMAASQTFWTPTIQVLSVPARTSSERLDDDPRLKYIPYAVEAGMWRGDVEGALSRSKRDGDPEIYADLHSLAQETLMRAHQSGVKLLIGTDSGDSYIFPGFAVHAELEAFVAAGISPEETLRMATTEPARYSGVGDRSGSISVGKVADLILLEGNPFVDIRNTRSVRGVMLAGRYLDRRSLDSLLEFTDEIAGGVRANLQMVWSAVFSPLMRVQLAD